MKLIAIKIVYKDDTVSVAKAREELAAAGFTIVYEDDAEGSLVDAIKSGGSHETYGATRVIVGTRG